MTTNNPYRNTYPRMAIPRIADAEERLADHYDVDSRRIDSLPLPSQHDTPCDDHQGVLGGQVRSGGSLIASAQLFVMLLMGVCVWVLTRIVIVELLGFSVFVAGVCFCIGVGVAVGAWVCVCYREKGHRGRHNCFSKDCNHTWTTPRAAAKKGAKR